MKKKTSYRGLYQPNVMEYDLEWIRLFLKEKHKKIFEEVANKKDDSQK